MQIFNYHPLTREIIEGNEPSFADEDPLDPGNWLIPANATTAEPPAQQEGKIRCFVDGAWALTYPLIVTPIPEVPPTPVQLQKAFTDAIQARLDAFARTRNYDGILSACSYVTDPNPRFASDGQTCVNKRSETWTAAYAILAEVEAATRPMPSSIADIEQDLPVLVWPA